MYICLFVCMYCSYLLRALLQPAPCTPCLNHSPSLPLAKLTSFSSNKCQVSRCIAASLHSLGVCASVCLFVCVGWCVLMCVLVCVAFVAT